VFWYILWLGAYFTIAAEQEICKEMTGPGWQLCAAFCLVCAVINFTATTTTTAMGQLGKGK